MRVLMVEPGKEPFVTEIGNNLESLQKAVDGHIEVLCLEENVLSYYPEFNYNTYLRLSDMITGGYSAEFELKPNEFSTYGRRVHFTPLWFPDGRYSPVANVIDAWTPDGMLSCSLSDYVDIQGNLYDDWHSAPKR